MWLPTLGVVAFFGLWQWLSVGPLSQSNLPYAVGTLVVLGQILGTYQFYSSLGETLLQAGIGFGLSVAIGIPLGLLVGLSEVFFRATRIIVEVLKPIPAVVILPLVVLQLGTSRSMSVFLITFALVPLLIVTTAAGARDADPVMLDAARSYRLGRWARTRRVVLPNALPFIATALRTSGAFALLIAVVAGVIGGAPGLGHDLDTYRQAGLLETVFAYVIVLGAVGVVLNFLLTRAEHRVIHWHESVRSQRTSTEHGRDRAKPVRGGSAGPFERWADGTDRLTNRAADWLQSRIGRRRRGRRFPQLRRWLLGGLQVAVPVSLLGLWWFVSAHSTDPFYPPASTIWHRFTAIWLSSSFVSDAVPSLRNLVVGLALAIALGVGAGTVIAQVRWLYSMFNPLVSFFRSIPGIAYLPLLIALMGFNAGERITAITLAAVFPVLLATIDGIRSVDETLLDVSRCYRLSRIRRLISVQLPAAAPRIFAGLELSIAAAVIVMVASELLGTSQGIGAQVLLAQSFFNFADMWAGIVLLALIGLVSNIIFRIVRSRVLAWYEGVRAVAKAP
jgi:ABC-type nitrate/sulfonate/bicarbonate transport system permease component